MAEVSLIFPSQLFENLPFPEGRGKLVMMEEFLIFRQYPFHKQKIALMRAAMKAFALRQSQNGWQVDYIEAHDPGADVRKLIPLLAKAGCREIRYIDPVDDWLERWLIYSARSAGIRLSRIPTPQFLNAEPELQKWMDRHPRLHQTDFYKDQRKRRRILLDSSGQPEGGNWTYDDKNRLRYPAGKKPPVLTMPDHSLEYEEAVAYTRERFPNNPGTLEPGFRYPVTPEEASAWLREFLDRRFAEFGPYEDALVPEEMLLNHSLLSPLLNLGLLLPEEVLSEALKRHGQGGIPLESTEGFVRQVLGWREFIRAVYLRKGREERTRNFWGFKRKMPNSFWTGETGIPPVDSTIRKVLKTGYCHHIERLMVLGNFMLLCEFDPDEVYRWFMVMFVDAWDWVMVPNVYGMSQFADGGLMSTKPYISGSNYLMKMGSFPKGEWQAIWDGLFWRFMHVHRNFFLQNPRLGMLVGTLDKMPEEKREAHLKSAEEFLRKLDG